MSGKAEELQEEVDTNLSKLLSAKPSRRSFALDRAYTVTVDLYGDALMNLPAAEDAHWRVQHDAIADPFRDHCVHDLGIVVRREVDDLFQQEAPLVKTVSMDELKDPVPDAKLSLPAFNVVTGS
eukprot:jgi/Tetstr1/455056/TSEL_041911.t1